MCTRPPPCWRAGARHPQASWCSGGGVITAAYVTRRPVSRFGQKENASSPRRARTRHWKWAGYAVHSSFSPKTGGAHLADVFRACRVSTDHLITYQVQCGTTISLTKYSGTSAAFCLRTQRTTPTRPRRSGLGASSPRRRAGLGARRVRRRQHGRRGEDGSGRAER